MGCESKDEEGTIAVYVATVQNILTACVTWTRNSSLGSRALTKAQNHVGLKPRNMLTPIKTQWAYLIRNIQCIIESHAAIDYIYNTMEGVGANIKNIILKWMDWDVVITVLNTTEKIVEPIKLNQVTVEKLMPSQAVEEFLELFFVFLKGMVPKVAQKQIEDIYLKHGEYNQ